METDVQVMHFILDKSVLLDYDIHILVMCVLPHVCHEGITVMYTVIVDGFMLGIFNS